MRRPPIDKIISPNSTEPLSRMDRAALIIGNAVIGAGTGLAAVAVGYLIVSKVLGGELSSEVWVGIVIGQGGIGATMAVNQAVSRSSHR